MKKIGILTFHRSINFGAFMQCYALSKRIQQDFPNTTVEVIDYATKRIMNLYDTSLWHYLFPGSLNLSKTVRGKVTITKLIGMLKSPKCIQDIKVRKGAFEVGYQFLPLSVDKIITDDFQKFFNQIKDNYDVIVVGSDCVWETIPYPFPNAYFLGADLGVKKLSYAASSDRMHISKVDSAQKQQTNQMLNQFAYLGIRDVATQNYLSAINPDWQLHHNCDPTILLDMEEIPADLNRVRELLKDGGIDLTQPIIGIMGDDYIGKLVRDIFGTSYQIVAIYENTKFADYYLNGITPLEWSMVFSLFSITFTKFFHGSLLSLKNGTPTIALDGWYSVGEGHKTKIKDVYDRLDLNEHYFVYQKEYAQAEKDQIEKAAKRFIKNPPKDKIRLALEKEGESYDSFKIALQKIVEE